MQKITCQSLVQSFCILSMAVIAGWLFLDKIAGQNTSREFIKLGVPISSILFLYKVSIFFRAKNLLFYQLLFIGGFGIDLAWFLSCFFLPLVWENSLSIEVKTLAGLVFLSVCVGNISLAVRTFGEKWKEVGESAFIDAYRPNTSSVNWGDVFRAMKILPVVYVPGVPKNFDNVISAAVLILMITGCILRSIDPVLSLIAIGIPFSIFGAYCLQMATYRLAEARKVRSIEKEKRVTFTSIA